MRSARRMMKRSLKTQTKLKVSMTKCATNAKRQHSRDHSILFKIFWNQETSMSRVWQVPSLMTAPYSPTTSIRIWCFTQHNGQSDTCAIVTVTITSGRRWNRIYRKNHPLTMISSRNCKTICMKCRRAARHELHRKKRDHQNCKKLRKPSRKFI